MPHRRGVASYRCQVRVVVVEIKSRAARRRPDAAEIVARDTILASRVVNKRLVSISERGGHLNIGETWIVSCINVTDICAVHGELGEADLLVAGRRIRLHVGKVLGAEVAAVEKDGGVARVVWTRRNGAGDALLPENVAARANRAKPPSCACRVRCYLNVGGDTRNLPTTLK